MTHSRAGIVMMIRRHLGDPQILATTNRAFGGMALPGGKAIEGEDMRRAAARELREETSVILLPPDLTLLAKGDNIIGDSICEVHLFYARHAWGEPRDVEDGTHCAWITFSELLDVSPFRDFYERYLPDGVHHLRETIFANASTAPPDPDSTTVIQNVTSFPPPKS